MRAIADHEYPADPYPGVVPGFSFAHLDAASHPLTPSSSATARWRLAGTDLDTWLATRGARPLAQRVPVLTFGSNRCPQKITWLRRELGLRGPVVVLRVQVDGLAAVWASGRRARDGARPASLARVPGARETHAVWMATPEQVAVLDVCEGRGDRYLLARLHAGRITTEAGTLLDDVWTYWPASASSDPTGRSPLLVDGVPVRCADVGQDAARLLTGTPAPLDTASATPDHARALDPRRWPSRLFVYGTLQPGERAWPLLADHADPAVPPVPARTAGRVHDTGRGHPALTLGPADPGISPGGRAPPAACSPERSVLRALGTVVTLRDPAAVLDALDDYEGPEYRRVRSVTYPADGTGGTGRACWMWVWDGPVAGLPVVHGLWSG